MVGWVVGRGREEGMMLVVVMEEEIGGQEGGE